MAKTVPLRIAGEDQPRAMRLDVNALAMIEDAAGCGFQRLVLADGRTLSAARLFIWAGLLPDMPAKKRAEWNLRAAGELIQEHLSAGGTLEYLMTCVTEALKASGFWKDAVDDEPAAADQGKAPAAGDAEGASGGDAGPTVPAASTAG